jgi:hypothetical protein
LTGFFHCVQPLDDGGYIVAGKVDSPPSMYYQGWIIRTDSLGNFLWEKLYGENGYDNFTWIEQTEDDGFIVTGGGETEMFGDSFILLLKLQSDITGFSVSREKYPESHVLQQNYPNPFNPFTTISYSIMGSNYVVLKIYDLLGREVQTLVDKFKKAGDYRISFSANSLSSGIYFYKLIVGNNFVLTKKMILMH